MVGYDLRRLDAPPVIVYIAMLERHGQLVIGIDVFRQYGFPVDLAACSFRSGFLREKTATGPSPATKYLPEPISRLIVDICTGQFFSVGTSVRSK
ncbi:MAG: hypothetical protein R3C10_00035 [Pirellulales bacterium]